MRVGFTSPGFSAIELIMVMAISAILVTNLFQIYNQVAKNMARVDQFVLQDTQLITLHNRLSKDFDGFSAIWFTQAELQARLQAKDKQSEKQEKIVEKKDDDKKNCKFLYSINKNENLDTLIFMTTSSLQSYAAAESRFVKVIYQLIPDPVHKDLYSLMRKEIFAPTEDIQPESLQNGTFYELINGIKSMKVEYVLVDKIELNKQNSQKNKEKSEEQASKSQKDKKESVEQPKAIIRVVKEWVVFEKGKDEKKSDHANLNDEKQDEHDLGGAAVPKFIIIHIVFGQINQQQERVYTLEFSIQSTVDAIPANVSAMKRSKNPEPEKTESEKKESEKKEKDGQETQAVDQLKKPLAGGKDVK